MSACRRRCRLSSVCSGRLGLLEYIVFQGCTLGKQWHVLERYMLQKRGGGWQQQGEQCVVAGLQLHAASR